MAILFEYGADMRRCPAGALWAAVFDPANLEITSMLIEAGANINAIDSNRQTALSQSLRSNNLEVITMLLEAGADVNAAGSDWSGAITCCNVVA